jgi:hypothetical protein
VADLPPLQRQALVLLNMKDYHERDCDHRRQRCQSRQDDCIEPRKIAELLEQYLNTSRKLLWEGLK